MQSDLHHIQRDITNHQVNIDEAHRQAETQKQLADQKHDEGNETEASYYEQEQERLEAQASQLEEELVQLTDSKQNVEARIADLQGQIDVLRHEHENKLLTLTDELNRLKGDSLL